MTANAGSPAPVGDERLALLYRDDMRAAASESAHPSEDDWVALATGSADPATRDRITDHLIACAACAAVYRGLAELRREAAAIDPGITATAASPWWTSRPWLAVAALALLVVGAGAIARRLPPATPAPSVATTVTPAPAPPPGEPPAQAAWAASLVAPAVEVPPVLALTMRGRADDELVAALGAAFDRYRAGDYDAAARALTPLADVRRDVPEIALYAGLSHLLAGRADDAQPLLTRATASETRGDDARWFAAVAHERGGDHAGAVALLRDLCARDNARRRDACNALGTAPAVR